MNVFKYAIIGGICTIVDFAIFLTLAKGLGIHYLIAATASFSIAVIVNYYLCIRFLFTTGVRFNRNIEILSIFLISAVGLIIHQIILFSAVELAHFGLVLAKAVATAAVFSWNYLGRKFFVFKPRPSQTRQD